MTEVEVHLPEEPVLQPDDEVRTRTTRVLVDGVRRDDDVYLAGKLGRPYSLVIGGVQVTPPWTVRIFRDGLLLQTIGEADLPKMDLAP